MTEYIAIGAMVYALLNGITRLTPTKKDDEIVSKIGYFWNFIFEATRKK